MADSQNALQKAIYEHLSADAELMGLLGSAGIFDRRLTERAMPYLVVAEIETRDFAPATEEHLVTLEAWSDGEGRKAVQVIAARVRALLHEASLAFDGAALVNLMHRSTRVKRAAKTKAFVAEMTFRAVTE